uniref:Actin-binding Rho-activating protein n=1 Tax=Callorhinchus milii TaxID=7868 RepID=V9L2Q1_CALMI|eukprot:gi/632989218/ref/XP_007883531.1/ PREDICTED: actin-binding Rho-activating protein-like [Callorhinchus milii]
MDSNVQRPVSKAIRRFRCITVVNNLTSNWQRWANEHSHQQRAGPTGWRPSSLEEAGEGVEELGEGSQPPPNEALRPRDTAKGNGSRSNLHISDEEHGTHGEELGESLVNKSTIRTVPIVKMVGIKQGSCGNELVSSLADRFNGEEPSRSEPPSLLGARSPVRRRLCYRAVEREEAVSRVVCAADTDMDIGETDIVNGNIVEANSRNDRGKRKCLSLKVPIMENLRSTWRRRAEEHEEKQKRNPFSEDFDYEYAMAVRLQRGDQGYGRPQEGSQTAERAERAHRHIHKEMEEMCFIIGDLGVRGIDGKSRVTFGRLFDRYVRVSDKVVGILMRARKHGLLSFQGEMLWKGKDDQVVITLLV